jgi:hypothetical protein
MAAGLSEFAGRVYELAVGKLRDNSTGYGGSVRPHVTSLPIPAQFVQATVRQGAEECRRLN